MSYNCDRQQHLPRYLLVLNSVEWRHWQSKPIRVFGAVQRKTYICWNEPTKRTVVSVCHDLMRLASEPSGFQPGWARNQLVARSLNKPTSWWSKRNADKVEEQNESATMTSFDLLLYRLPYTLPTSCSQPYTQLHTEEIGLAKIGVHVIYKRATKFELGWATKLDFGW